ncbi:hypothetical protein AGLY_013696 [Aphis glycines]|uniref:Uncharacterized protein n=1 Tax=Aphis glycines TaxID=307491 RepID=A0A6G0T712_APHGL|nr:hypothetical protein AGLY_013696 [Aphis glycines]
MGLAYPYIYFSALVVDVDYNYKCADAINVNVHVEIMNLIIFLIYLIKEIETLLFSLELYVYKNKAFERNFEEVDFINYWLMFVKIRDNFDKSMRPPFCSHSAFSVIRRLYNVSAPSSKLYFKNIIIKIKFSALSILIYLDGFRTSAYQLLIRYVDSRNNMRLRNLELAASDTLVYPRPGS